MTVETLKQLTEDGGRVQARLVRYGGRDAAFVDIRKFYVSKGRALPSKKGVAIGADVYRTVREVLVEPTDANDRIEALMASDLDGPVELTPAWATTKIRVLEYQGLNYVDIRKFYERVGGSFGFTKKGVMLSLEDFRAVQKGLVEGDEAILEAMGLAEEVLADAA